MKALKEKKIDRKESAHAGGDKEEVRLKMQKYTELQAEQDGEV